MVGLTLSPLILIWVNLELLKLLAKETSMSEEKKNGFNSIIKEDAERKRAKKKLHREITFREYLALVAEDPAIAQLSASRLWEIIQNAEVVQLRRFELKSEQLEA